MRTFRLINGTGSQVCNITDKQLFFHDPKGLGLDRNLSYRQVGDRWIRINKKRKQTSITGKVALLGDDPYLSYFNFLQFLSIEPLTLLYTPNNQAASTVASGVEYRMRVDLAKLSKTEMTKQGYLDCDISFTPLTPWYKYTVISNGQTAKPLKWGSFEDLGAIEWGIEWGEFNEWERGITSDVTADSPTKLTVYGPIVNPRWTHYVNGNEFETGKVNATIDENEYLLVDNSVDPYVIEKRSAVNDGFISDLYASSDFTTKRFISLQNGINTVHVTGDSAEDPYAKLEGYLYYESV